MKFKKIGLVLLGVVLALLSLEIALRMAGFAFEKFAGRSAVIEKKKGLRILCLGDSYTYGLGVAREESYPAQLERLLRKEPGYDEVEVINCGKPGINTPLLAKDFRRLATRYQPDIVLLLIGVNDAWNFEGMEGAFSSWPERIRSFLSGLRIGKFFTIARERPRLQEVKNKLAAVEKMGGFNNFYCWQAILLGNECRDNNEFEQAMLYYDVALKIDPRDARIVVELVRLYRKIIENEAAKCSLDNKEKTISSLAGAESVIEKINPENRDAGKEAQGLYAELISYGNYCRKAKEFGKADMYFRLARKIEQDDPVGNIESVRLKKELLEERQNHGNSGKIFPPGDDLILSDNSAIDLLIYNSENSTDKKSIVGELLAFEKAVKSRLSFEDLLLLLTKIMVFGQDLEKVYEEFDELFVLLDDPSRTIAFYRWLAESCPGDPLVYMRLARQYKKVRDYEQSRFYYGKVLTLDHGNQEAVAGVENAGFFIKRGESECFILSAVDGNVYRELDKIVKANKVKAGFAGGQNPGAVNPAAVKSEKCRSEHALKIQQIVGESLKYICDLCRQRKTRLIFISYPLNVPDVMAETAEREHMSLIDLRSAFKAELIPDNLRRYFQPDWHCTAEGNRVVAATVAEYLKTHEIP